MPKCFYCLGEHETSQCLSRATNEIVSGQEEAASIVTDAIEEAGYQTREELRKVGDRLLGGLDGVREAVLGLNDFLSWAHSETIWRMEKEIELLTGIHNMLKNPRATQADELYKMGVDSFKRHRLADSVKLLEEARELNPGDYRIQVTLGHVYMQTDTEDKALECFRAAIDYSRSSNYRRSALLLTARTLRCLERIPEAINALREVTSIQKDYPPAHYELASCIADMFKGRTAPQ